MKNLRNFALAAFALLGFAACQQEEFAPEIKNPTHSVTFVAGAPETKTTVDISDGATAKFAWTAEDINRFTVYENGTEAKKADGVLAAGKMTVKATFEGPAPETASYVAVVNESNATQIMSAEAYDEDADILVSKAVSTFDGENGVLLQFKREVAIAKMTLKGLDPGEVVNHVTVSSTADIAGKYGVDGWASPAKSLEISSASYMGETDGYSIVANASGESVVWFTCIPQTDATLTVKVEAADGDTYTKEFSKPIILTRGNVKAFGVAMTKDTPKTYGYQKISSVEDYAPGDYIIVAHAYKDDCPTKGDFAIANSLTLSSNKLTGQDVTSIIDNDVIYASDGANYKLSLSGDKDNIEISNGTDKLGWDKKTDLKLNGNTTWSLSLNNGDGGSFILLNNSIASGDTKRTLAFQSYSTSGTTRTASLKFAAYAVSNVNEAPYAAIELYKYQEVSPSTPKYSISFAEVTGGTLSASPVKAEAGAEVTLTATPDEGYAFNNDWTVTNAETSEPITVENGTFTMPAANVNVTASFKQLSYAITANPAENGTYTVKVGEEEVTSAVYGAKVLLEATPAEGYICDGWTVVDAESNSVYVSNNSFTMPASAVAISTTFSVKPEDITYDHAGTAEDPYSVADVLKYISTLGTATSTEDVYVKGVITSIDEVSTKFGNATYKIKDEGVDNEVKVFRGLYLDGAKFTSADQIGVGDEVVVVGKVLDYNRTPEVNAGNKIVSIIKAPYLKATASKETGISAAGETVTITVDTNVDSWTATSDNGAFVVGTPSGNTVDVVVSKNTDATERTATITVTAGTLSETITLTQKGASTGGDPTEQTIFLETFGSTTSTSAFNEYTGYSATAEMFTTSGDVNTHYSGSGKIGKNNLKGVSLSSKYTGASGLSGCYHTGTANTEATILQISDINITDCVNISVSFGALGGSSSHKVSVYYTIDGGAETALITDGAITNKSWTLLNANIAGTGKSLTLIFKHKPTKAWTIRMDDIRVVGTK